MDNLWIFPATITNNYHAWTHTYSGDTSGVHVFAEAYMTGLDGWGTSGVGVASVVDAGVDKQINASAAEISNATEITYFMYAHPSGSGTCTIRGVLRADFAWNPTATTIDKRCVLYDSNGKVVHIHDYFGAKSKTDEDLEKIAFKTAAMNPNIIDISTLKVLHVEPEPLSQEPVEYKVDLAKKLLVSTPIKI